MLCVRVFVYLLALESSGLTWHGMTSFFYASYVTFCFLVLAQLAKEDKEGVSAGWPNGFLSFALYALLAGRTDRLAGLCLMKCRSNQTSLIQLQYSR